MTGSRQETVLACEGEKAGLETHQVAIVLGNGRRQIVIPKFARDATQIVKGVNLTAHEVSKLWLWVNSTYSLRLWHSTRQKA